jgi:hypothetical protein
MTVDQFIVNVAKIEDYLRSDFTRDIVLMGCKDLSVKIANRVQETSVLGSGASYDYSTKTTLVGKSSFTTKGAFDKVLAKAKSKKNTDTHWVTIKKGGSTYRLIVLPGGYKEIRSLEGHLNSKKNYSRTKEMWDNFGVKSSDQKEVVIGGQKEASQNKINWNTARDGDVIIAPNQQEIQEFKDFVSNSVKRYIDASLRS